MASITDTTTEQHVIGASIVNEDACGLAVKHLRPDHFSDECHRVLFSVLIDRFENCSPIDRTLVLTDSVSAGMPRPDASAYIDHCVRTVPDVRNAFEYVQRVQKLASLRALASVVPVLDTITEDTDPLEMASELDKRIQDATATKTHRVAWGESEDATIREVEESMRSTCSLAGFSTGIQSLDRRTNGLHPKEVTVLAGRTGQGKSALAMNIAQHVAATHGPVLFFSLEMDTSDLQKRMLSSITGVPLGRMIAGTITVTEWDKVRRAHEAVRALDIEVIMDPDLSVETMRAVARTKKKLCLVVIDYLQIMRGSSTRRDNRVAELDEDCKRIKRAALTLKVPILLVAQLNRAAAENKGERPQLHHLRESGGIENNADNVWMIYCKAMDEVTDRPVPEAEAVIIIRKQRKGARNVEVPVLWTPSCVRFSDRGSRNDAFAPDPYADD